MYKKIMDDKTSMDIEPERIREAISLRGYTATSLADEIGVSRQAVSSYQCGETRISYDNLLKISMILDLPFEYFYKPINKGNKTGEVFYRSSYIPKLYKSMYESKLNIIVETFDELRGYINFPKVNIPRCKTTSIEYYLENEDSKNEKSNDIELTELRKLEIENMTLQLREYWGLDKKPISNLVDMLSVNGFIISRIELEDKKTDAFSQWKDNIPYIILGDGNKSSVRSRFNIAHELGHLILHEDVTSKQKKDYHKLLEKEANYFASSFLLPMESFSSDLYTTNINSFIPLKKKWKVSIAAMIVRAYQIGILTDLQYANLNRYLNQKGWRRKEPLDEVIEFERPRIFKESLELLFNENIITAEEFLYDISIYPEELEELCFLDKGFFEKFGTHKINKMKLRLVK